MRNTIVALVLAASIFLAAGIGYYAGFSSQRSVTSTSTATSVSTSTTTTTTATGYWPSLELISSVQPSTIPQGHNVTISSEVFNQLSVAITFKNLSPITDWSEAPCGLGSRVVGLDIYSGHYSFANLSSATPLLLWNASGPPPPCLLYPNFTYEFLPNSHTANVSTLFLNSTVDVSYNDVFGGDWVNCPYPYSGRICNFEGFQPGPYTVLAFDAWGQRVMEYFEVT